MPHYDESFIHDDNLNQRRNKRSYRVYKQGLGPISLLEPTDVLQALEERGTSVIKRNIRNIKHRGSRNKVDQAPQFTNSNLYQKNIYKSPDIIVDHCPSNRLNTIRYDLRNNNVNLLSPCKSLDNLVLKQKKGFEGGRQKIRNGLSLQNLLQEDRLKHYTSPSEDVYGRCDSTTRKFYSVVDPYRRTAQRLPSRTALAPGPGIYRQINGDSINCTKRTGMNCIHYYRNNNNHVLIKQF